MNVEIDLLEELLGTIAELDANGIYIPNYNELYNRLYDTIHKNRYIKKVIATD